MSSTDNNRGKQDSRSDVFEGSSKEVQKEQNKAAFEEAMQDIDNDVDLGIHSPNDDLDEGESARIGEDKTDLV